MSTFIYKARSKKGEMIAGELSGTNAIMIKKALVDKGLFPITVQPKGVHFSLNDFLKKRIKQKVLVNFTRQFHVMFEAGSPIDRILQTLAKQTDHFGLKEALEKIYQDVSAGLKLSEAFGKFPHFFNSLYTNMLAVGERGGVLDKTLKEMTRILHNEDRIRKKVKSAMLYPKIVIFTLIAVMVGMLWYVIPVFSDFYGNQGAELPMPTQILILLSDIFLEFWYLAFGVMGGVYFAWLSFLKTEYGQTFSSWMQFHLPIFGTLNLFVANARFGHLISALYRAGLPLSQALEVVAGTIDNSFYSKEVQNLRKRLDQGQSLSQAMEDTQYFTAMVRETTAVGEQTGSLDKMLEHTASYYDEEIDDILKNLSTLIEPIMLFGIFIMVGFLALAVFMPIWNMSSVILGGS